MNKTLHLIFPAYKKIEDAVIDSIIAALVALLGVISFVLEMAYKLFSAPIAVALIGLAYWSGKRRLKRAMRGIGS